MPSVVITPEGEKKELDLIADLIPQNEAVVNQWCGKIRSGKTYGATKQALDDLNAGNVVYTSWLIKWDGYDERKSWFKLWLGRIGLKKNFIVYPKENYHYLPYESKDLRVYAPFTNFFDKFFSLTDCTVYLDEAQAILSSYEKTDISKEKQNSILYTGHLNRSINIISQRPSAIHAIMRANISRWYRMTKSEGWFGVTFRREEFQEADGNNLPRFDTEPEEVEEYPGRKEIYNAYDSKYMRGDTPTSQKNFAELLHLTKEECKAILKSRKAQEDNA